MGIAQEPSSPQSVVTGSPVRSPNGRRRRLRGGRRRAQEQQQSLHNSMPQLHLSPVKGVSRKESVLWSSDSFSHLKLNFSLTSLGETVSHEAILMGEIEDSIEQQSNRKFFLEQIIKKSLILAKARYLGGSELGAILSMRKIHRHTSTKAYVAAACLQLITLRDMVQTAIDGQSPLDLDVTVQRNMLYGILSDLQEATVKCPAPTNAVLLQQLQAMLMDESYMAGIDDSHF